MVNVGKADTKGFEVYLLGTFFEINDITLSYTYTDAKDKSNDRTSKHIADISKHRIFLNHLLHITKELCLSSNLTLQTDHYEQYNNEWKDIGGYYTIDTKLGYKWRNTLTFEAGVKNLFDRNYQYSYGYPMPGRYWYGRVSMEI